jgi:hypothetical protein
LRVNTTGVLAAAMAVDLARVNAQPSRLAPMFASAQARLATQRPSHYARIRIGEGDLGSKWPALSGHKPDRHSFRIAA